MATEDTNWLGRHSRLTFALFVVLLVVIAGQCVLLARRDAADRRLSDLKLRTFLRGDTTSLAEGSSVYVRLHNVRFKWSDRVYIDTGNMAVRAVPLHGSTVDFDALESFRMIMQESVVLVRPDVLAGMFNESIFNYPGARVRGLTVTIEKDDRGVPSVLLSGKVNVVAWVPFTMYTHLSVDTATNTLVLEVDHLKVFKFMPATKLIRWTPLNLDRLISLPPNNSLLVHGNRIMVKPLVLFPPPRIDGQMSKVDVGDNSISITFAGDEIPQPEFPSRNYVYLRGGTSQFGRFRMVDTNALILDRDPSNPFVFSLLHYADMLRRSAVEIPDTRTVRITMPDFADAPANPGAKSGASAPLKAPATRS